MHVHVLGICGTFMAGIAGLARQLGYTVTGQDENVYPPMSTQLRAEGIAILEGYNAASIPDGTDCVIVGNAMKRGMPVIERVLNEKIPYQSGPAWLYDNVLKHKKVIAVSGTHGKTTTSAMTVAILEKAGFNPGFLIGGVLKQFDVSARLTPSDYFVIEADEYDTAFFDKRSKFVHYSPDYLSINNLEFDHADIYQNLEEIIKQFHGLVRIMPSNGYIIHPKDSESTRALFAKGCWSQIDTFGLEADWHYELDNKEGSAFKVFHRGELVAEIAWSLIGIHNVNNALVSIALATAAGVEPKHCKEALSQFENVKRRLEKKAEKNGVIFYDDFAHHPTAIASTLSGLRQHVGHEKIIVILECGSYTMRTGVHGQTLVHALAEADQVFVLNDINQIGQYSDRITNLDKIEDCFYALKNLSGKAHLVTMSNKGVEEIHDKLFNTVA